MTMINSYQLKTVYVPTMPVQREKKNFWLQNFLSSVTKSNENFSQKICDTRAHEHREIMKPAGLRQFVKHARVRDDVVPPVAGVVRGGEEPVQLRGARDR